MLQSSLTSLLHTYNINKRGLCAVIGVPKEGVESMPDVKSIMRLASGETNCDFFFEEIVLKDGFSWLDMSQLFNVNMEMEETEDKSTQGSVFNYEVALSVPNDDFSRGKVFRAYQNREFILVVKERTDAWRVIGSLERGARFTRELKTGTVRKDSNKYTCAFTWQVGEQPAYYTEAFPRDFYFDVSGVVDGTHQKVFVQIDELVFVDWGDGTTTMIHNEEGAFIQHTYAENELTYPYEYRVYHRNLATQLNVNELGEYNGSVGGITGDIPPVTEMFANGNILNEADIITALGLLNATGAINGNADLTDQTPAVSASAPLTAAKAPLLLKGWTVTY